MNLTAPGPSYVWVTSPHRWGPGKIHHQDCRHAGSTRAPGKWMTLPEALCITNDAGQPLVQCSICYPKKGR